MPTIGLPHNSDKFRVRREAFYQGVNSRTRCGQAATLRINLNIDGYRVVALPVHAPSRAPLHPPFTQSPFPPRPLVGVGQNFPHRHQAPGRRIPQHMPSTILLPLLCTVSYLLGPAVININSSRSGCFSSRGGGGSREELFEAFYPPHADSERLFIGTQFNNLDTAVDSPEAASCALFSADCIAVAVSRSLLRISELLPLSLALRIAELHCSPQTALL